MNNKRRIEVLEKTKHEIEYMLKNYKYVFDDIFSEETIEALDHAIYTEKTANTLARAIHTLNDNIDLLKYDCDKEQAKWLIKDISDIFSWKNNNWELEKELANGKETQEEKQNKTFKEKEKTETK